MPPGGKDLRIGVSGDTRPYERAIDRATSATEKYRDSLTSLEIELLKVEKQLADDQAKAAREAEQAMHKQEEAAANLGQGVMTAGLAIGAGLALATKAAIDWESAWAGVEKVTDGSPEQMAALEGELRNLATTLPATHGEIAAVAEAAGQLGVKREDIADFTETMIAMGVSTNLSAEEAATSMAKFANIMGTSVDDADRLGSAIVALGNDGASTEADIMAMGLRIAAAGKVAGFTEADVLALANSLSSLGIEAEAGGSAISTIMVKIDTAVAESGDQLESFARVAGMTADQFAAAWERDPAAALLAFEKGLAGVEEQGGNTFAVMNELGITEIRQRGAVLALAQGHELLANSLKVGERSWEENNALMTEANKRYETTASKLQVAENNVAEFGIAIGEQLLPVLGAAAEMGTAFLDVFGDLPGPVKTGIAVLGTLAAVFGTLGGAALLMAPKIRTMRTELALVGGAGGLARRGMSGMMSMLGGPWGIALGAATLALGYFITKQADARQAVEDLKSTLDEQTGAFTDNTRAAVAKTLGDAGVLEVAEELGLSLKDVTDAALGNEKALGRVTGRLDDLRGGYIEGHSSAIDAASGINKVEDAITGQNDALGKAIDEKRREIEATKGSTEAQGDNADALEGATGKTNEYADATADAAQEVADLTRQANDLLDALNAVSDINLKTLETEIAFREGVRGLKDQIGEKSNALYASRKATRAEQEAIDANRGALADMIGKSKAAANAVYEKTLQTHGAEAAGKAWDSTMSRNIGTLLREADNLGLNQRETRKYIAAILGVPEKSLTKYSAANLTDILAQARALDSTADKLDGREVETTFVNRRVNIIETRRPSLPWFGVEERAHGGPLEAGRLSWVGEAGPELVMFDQDVTVIPHAKSRQIAASAESLSLSSAKHGGRLTASASSASSSSAAPAPITINMRSVDLDERRLAHVQRVAAIHERIGTGRPT